MDDDESTDLEGESVEREPARKRWRHASAKDRQTVEDPTSSDDTDGTDGTAATAMEVQDGGFVSSAADDTDDSDVDADVSGSEFDADDESVSESGDEAEESGDAGGETAESSGDDGGEAAKGQASGRRVTGAFS